jgi:formylglycine-generating enzyme required for sulfatase activity
MKLEEIKIENFQEDPCRISRGGSWNFVVSSARAKSRIFFGPDTRYDFSGFRLMRTEQ